MSTDHKLMAKRLRASLADRGVEVTHSEALEIVAHEHGARDWNTLAAEVSTTRPRAFGPVIPVLRIFDVAKAREFYSRVPRLRDRLEHTSRTTRPCTSRRAARACSCTSASTTATPARPRPCASWCPT